MEVVRFTGHEEREDVWWEDRAGGSPLGVLGSARVRVDEVGWVGGVQYNSYSAIEDVLVVVVFARIYDFR